jgi:tetratricopeptide (TPR) repeat protein
MMRSRRSWLPALTLGLALGLSGCAATQTTALLSAPRADLPRQSELKATPFIAQERYQCGPAALAMALQSAGFAVDADALVPEVYLPQREGSLQVEMIAAGRRNGAVSMTIPPRMDALITELAAGNPVLVMQNLSLPIAPKWHYAVAIGYDVDRRDIILRSGTTERLVMPLSTFEHTWARSGYWGMVTLAPGRLPASAEEATVVDALVAFEKTSRPGAARTTYALAARRWPDNLTLALGLGNTAYAAGDKPAAADAFQGASERHPDSGAARNNLAVVLMEMGQLKAARAAAEQALALGGPWREAALDTLASIERAEKRRQR